MKKNKLAQLEEDIQKIEIAPNTTIEAIFETAIQAVENHPIPIVAAYVPSIFRIQQEISKVLTVFSNAPKEQCYQYLVNKMLHHIETLEEKKLRQRIFTVWLECELYEINNESNELLKLHFNSIEVTDTTKAILEEKAKALYNRRTNLAKLIKEEQLKVLQIQEQILRNTLLEIRFLLGRTEFLTKRAKRFLEKQGKPQQIPLETLQNRLNSAFDFQVPVQYSKFIEQAYNRVDWEQYQVKVGEAALTYPFKDIFESWSVTLHTIVQKQAIEQPVLAKFRYPYTPPEVFLTFWLGADGLHYGMLNIAPELEETTLPFVCCDPYHRKIQVLGTDLYRGLGNLINQQWYWKAQGMLKNRTINTLELKTLAYFVKHTIEAKPTTPFNYQPSPIKDGWRYEPTADGVGVYAPKATFSPESIVILSTPKTIEPLLKQVNAFLHQGYPASALWAIRENYYTQFLDNVYSEIAPLWARAYQDLGRPLLATHVFQQLQQNNK